MMEINWIEIGIFICGMGAAVARNEVIGKAQSKILDQLREGQTRIWTSMDLLRQNQASVKSELDGFRMLEEERHEKEDVAIDELKGDTRRIERTLQEDKMAQVQVSEQVKNMRERLESLRCMDPHRPCV